jgi:hypothetical protein
MRSAVSAVADTVLVIDGDPFSPDSMISTVSAAAPLARHHVKQHFIGYPADWSLEFNDAQQTSGVPTATVYFSTAHPHNEVYCEVLVESYPFLRFALPGQVMRVKGTVDDIRTYQVRLRDATLAPVRDGCGS